MLGCGMCKYGMQAVGLIVEGFVQGMLNGAAVQKPRLLHTVSLLARAELFGLIHVAVCGRQSAAEGFGCGMPRMCMPGSRCQRCWRSRGYCGTKVYK